MDKDYVHLCPRGVKNPDERERGGGKEEEGEATRGEKTGLGLTVNPPGSLGSKRRGLGKEEANCWGEMVEGAGGAGASTAQA